jgi:hypothetical protein
LNMRLSRPHRPLARRLSRPCRPRSGSGRPGGSSRLGCLAGGPENCDRRHTEE